MDDGIVVVENVCRLIEQGSDPGSIDRVLTVSNNHSHDHHFDSSHLPIGFYEGIVGMLFTEFLALASRIYLWYYCSHSLSDVMFEVDE